MNDPKLYYAASALTADPGRTGWTEITLVKDVTLNDECEEQDATTRANGGRKSTDVGLRDNSVDFEIDWDPTDAGFIKLRTAYTTKAAVAVAVMDSAVATGAGVAGNWKVTSFARNEPLGGRITANVTLKAFSFMGDL